MRSVLMLAYAQFFNDARIKAYVYALLEQGVRVDVVCLKDPVSRSETVRGTPLEIHFVQEKYQGDSALRYLAGYLGFFFRAARITAARCLRGRYTAIHVHNMPDFLVFCAWLPRMFGIRVILDMHDVMLAGVLTKFSGAKRRVLYAAVWLQSWLSVRCCDALIFADHSQREFLFSKGIRHRETRIVLNLPDDRVFRARARRPENEIVQLIYHGSLAARAGLDLAIRAVERVAQQRPIHLTLIGAGEQREELERLCRERGLESLVTFKDFIPVEALQETLETYDIGVVANRKTLMSEHCMLPVKMMEYLLIGLPVVVPSLKVIRDYFDGTMVSYFEPENVGELAERIAELAARPDLREAQVRAARAFFERYPWVEQKKMYCQLVLSPGGRGSA